MIFKIEDDITIEVLYYQKYMHSTLEEACENSYIEFIATSKDGEDVTSDMDEDYIEKCYIESVSDMFNEYD